MIEINGKELRNLQEQVAYLSELHEAGKALASWGIKIIGQVDSADDLPVPYIGDYGDAYAVGTEAPFNFYIWTRAAVAGGEAYWFPFGEISIAGPQGPQGPQGIPGLTGLSTKWYTGANFPANANQDDMYLSADGRVYQYKDGNWILVTSIQGPQGAQGVQGPQGIQGEQGPIGPQGPMGDVGGFINIAGILTSADQLPTPSSIQNLTQAYLVEHTGGTDQSNDHYDLYIQVGSTSEEATWNNVGPFNAATLVTVNGVGQNVWDADSVKMRAVFKKADRYEEGGIKTYDLIDPETNEILLQPASGHGGDRDNRIGGWGLVKINVGKGMRMIDPSDVNWGGCIQPVFAGASDVTGYLGGSSSVDYTVKTVPLSLIKTLFPKAMGSGKLNAMNEAEKEKAQAWLGIKSAGSFLHSIQAEKDLIFEDPDSGEAVYSYWKLQFVTSDAEPYNVSGWDMHNLFILPIQNYGSVDKAIGLNLQIIATAVFYAEDVPYPDPANVTVYKFSHVGYEMDEENWIEMRPIYFKDMNNPSAAPVALHTIMNMTYNDFQNLSWVDNVIKANVQPYY